MRRSAALLAAGAVCLAVAGCGLERDSGSPTVSLTVTQDFGRQPVLTVHERSVPAGQTMLQLLERHFTVATGPGGAVHGIGDIAAGSGQRWFEFVNGIGTTDDPATLQLHPGDRIWWDLHDASQRTSIPAVVGSFPEPFVHGFAGRRYPVVVECGSGLQTTCDRIATNLHGYGVAAPSQLLGGGSGSDSIGVLVGTWPQLRPLVAGEFLARGPRSSGVYARFAAGGAELQLLDPDGRVVRTLGAGAGLVAATRDVVSQPVWVIGGTDRAGVAAAAAALTAGRLANRFAVAVSGGQELPIPAAP